MKKLAALFMIIALICMMIPAVTFAADAGETTLVCTGIFDKDGEILKDEPLMSANFNDVMALYDSQGETALYLQTVTADGTISRKIISDVSKLKIVDKNGKEVGTVANCKDNQKFISLKVDKMYDCYLQYVNDGQTLKMPVKIHMPNVYCSTNYKSSRATYINDLNCSATKTNYFYLIAPDKNAGKLHACYDIGNKSIRISITKKNNCFTAKKINDKTHTVYKITLKRPFTINNLTFDNGRDSTYLNFNIDLYLKVKISGNGKVFDSHQVSQGDISTSSTKLIAIPDYEGKDLEKGIRYIVDVVPEKGYKFAGFYYGNKKISTDGPFSDKYYRIVDSQGKMIDSSGQPYATVVWKENGSYGLKLAKDICEKNKFNTDSIKFDKSGYAWVSLEQYLAVTGFTNLGIIVNGGEHVIFNSKSLKWHGKIAGNNVTNLAGKTITAKFVKIK